MFVGGSPLDLLCILAGSLMLRHWLTRCCCCCCSVKGFGGFGMLFGRSHLTVEPVACAQVPLGGWAWWT
uniref:Putative secreted protein n=1 Tax=Anopheles darlingi TaxID=43151 RepID=A0A2M4DDJ0_ANODA